MKSIIAQLTFLLLPAFIYSKCCFDTAILFKIEGGLDSKCSDFGADNYGTPFKLVSQKFPEVAQMYAEQLNGVCRASVCGNGEKKTDSPFCGKGICNSVGCDCVEGCIEGDPQESFFGKHGANVSKIPPNFFDSIRNAVLNKWFFVIKFVIFGFF